MSDNRVAHSASSEPGVTHTASPREGLEPPSKQPPVSYEDSDVSKPKQRRRWAVRVTNNLISTVFSTEPPDPAKITPFKARASRRNSAKSHEKIFGGGGPGDQVESPRPSRRPGALDVAGKDTFTALFGDVVIGPVSRRSYDGDTHRRLFGDEPGPVSRTRGYGYEDTRERLFGPVGPPVVRRARRPGMGRPENTQEVLFGPPLPAAACRGGRVRRTERSSSFDLFNFKTTEKAAGKKPPPSTDPVKDEVCAVEADQANRLDNSLAEGRLQSDSRRVQIEEQAMS